MGTDHTAEPQAKPIALAVTPGLATSALAVLNEKEAADRLRMKVSTLRAWRCRGTGPRFMKFGAAVRYRSQDVEQFMAANTIDTTLGALPAAA